MGQLLRLPLTFGGIPGAVAARRRDTGRHARWNDEAVLHQGYSLLPRRAGTVGDDRV
jgi:hypothetical protein